MTAAADDPAGDVARMVAWSGLTAGRLVVLVGADPHVAARLAGVAGPGGLVAVDPDPSRVTSLRGHLAAAGRHGTVLDGEPSRLPVLSGRVDLTWLELPVAGDGPAALAEARRVTRPGGTVLVRERERPGEPPLRQAERLADGLAMAGLDDVRTMVALALRADGAEGDGAFGQVAATLQDGLAGVRLLRLATTVAAAGTLRSA